MDVTVAGQRAGGRQLLDGCLGRRRADEDVVRRCLHQTRKPLDLGAAAGQSLE